MFNVSPRLWFLYRSYLKSFSKVMNLANGTWTGDFSYYLVKIFSTMLSQGSFRVFFTMTVHSLQIFHQTLFQRDWRDQGTVSIACLMKGASRFLSVSFIFSESDALIEVCSRFHRNNLEYPDQVFDLLSQLNLGERHSVYHTGQPRHFLSPHGFVL